MATPKRSGPGTHWTDDEIKVMKDLCQMCSALGVARELGRSKGAVTSQAKRLKISFAKDETNTYFGRVAEEYVAKMLPGSKLLTKDFYHSPYDIDWQGKRINVKAAVLRYYTGAGSYYWNFIIKQGPETCDYFLLLGYKDKHENPAMAWLLPSNVANGKNIMISHNPKKSMYQKFQFNEVIA